MNDLPEHDNINLSFKLFVIQSWDGYSPYNYGYTPDEWKLDVEGGQTLLFTSFDNAGRNNQIYPGQIIDGVTPTLRNYQEGAAERNTLGYSFYGDAVYDINISFAHSGSSLKLNFAGAGTTNLNDIESWGLDDVKLLARSSSKGLQGWTTYVDENLNGKRDSGEISTKTDAQGKYSFTLSPGSYTIAEEVQPGWTQISPTTTTYQVNLTSGQSIQNLNFGNTNGRPNGATDNVAPSFISTPTTNEIARQTFRYEASAIDLNSDPLRYSLLVNPDGMVLDPETGSLSWRPTDSQIGTQDVVLQVKDPYGGVDVQSFQVNVSSYNTAPIFTTLPGYNTPLNPVAPGQVFQYQPKTQDAEGDRVSYRLTSAPNGATVDPNTGFLTWTASSDQIGQNPLFSITASDGHGSNTTQSFNVKVFESTEVNAIPSISSQPRTQISVGRTYLYQLIAADSNNDSLTYSLESGSQGMFIDGKGILTWQPTPSQIGSHAVTLSVSDGRGGIVKQSFNIEVVNASGLINHAPVIASTPVLTTNANKLYQYNLNASDVDNDVLFWALDKAPQGMSVDPKQGTLRWIPQSNQLGDNEVVVRVQDAQGAYSTQTFTLRVTGVNAPPQITSTPDTRASVGQSYQYQIAATDPENNPLSFSLGQHPNGMLIDSVTGQLSWNPDSTQLGLQDVTVQVIDSEGAQATQKFTVQVGTTPINHAPVIASTPGLLADINTGYRYQLQATDRDNNPLTYQLLSGPQGMTIDLLTGLTQWQNPVAGTYQVVVGALDNGGLGAAQSFTLNAKANGLPTIQSTPSLKATPGSEYQYDLQAKDPEGDKLTYTLDSTSQALGITLDNLGRLRWTPTSAQLGTKSVTLTVTDSAGAIVTQQFNLSVTADTEAPKVNLIGSTNIADIGEDLFFQARATDNVGIKNLQLFINDNPVAIDGNGLLQLKAQQPGAIIAKAIATDLAGNQMETTTTIQVRNPADTDAPQIDLDLSGITDGTITGPVAIKGSVTDTNLDYYVLEVAPLDGSAPFKEVFRGTGNVSNGTLGTFDPSLLLNDSYILRLNAFDTNGQGTTTEQTLSVAGELKLGNFRLSFTDLTIPVTGIPITLIRTYDSLTSNNTDDFGYGWRMEFRDTDLRTSLGKDETYEVFGIRTKAFDEKTRVYITLPGGKREGFTFKPTIDPISRFFPSVAGSNPTIYLPAFVADSGVTSTLSVQNVRMLRTAEAKFYGLSGDPYNPEDSLYGATYTLTTKEGIVYNIDAQTGDLLKVTDTNGNTLTYTDSDITSSTGQKVTFERDAEGRITSVTDPMGQKVKYAYNDKGDLIGVTDREGNTTQYEYDQAQAHYLDKIIDPLGRTGIKNEYDEKGRLKGILDANGNPVEMIYDPNNSIQKVKDALGNETVYEYDQQGNVVTEIDAEGKITKNTYDANNNVLKATIISDRSGPDGFTTEYTYDSNSNMLSMKDALENTTYYTYDSLGNRLSETDALGHTITSTYNKRGVRTSQTDALGNTTNYEIGSFGKIYGLTNSQGQRTSLTYDDADKVSSIVNSLDDITQYTYDKNGMRLSEIRTITTSSEIKTLTTQWTYNNEGLMLSQTDAENQTTSYEYDALGQKIAMIDALGHRTSYRYNDKGEQIEIIYPDETPNTLDDNLRERFSYDVLGRQISSIDLGGRETRYVYDKAGQLVETLLPNATPNNWLDNPRIFAEYYDDGLVKAQIDERGNRTEFRYDAKGQLTEVIFADDTPQDLSDNSRDRRQYNAIGQQTAVIDALGHKTAYVYDDTGHLLQTQFADGTSTNTEYDKLGRRTAVIDQNGKRTEYSYDALSRLIGVKDALNNWTTYSYNEIGNLITQTDAENHTTQYEYDGVGRRTAVINPMGQRSTIAYDAVGNLKTQTDFNGQTTSYIYNPLDQLTTKQFQDGSAWTFTYTPTGQQDIVTLLDTNQQVVDRYDYDYNERDWLIQRTDSLSGATSRTVSYTYDVTGNKTSITTPSGTVNYTYDGRNRLDRVIQNGITLADYDHNAVNNLTQTTFSNGTQEIRQYDLLNRLTYLENQKGNMVLSSYTYTLDKTGNRTQITEKDGRTSNYIYDNLYRLTEEKITDPFSGNRTTNYFYDKVGNRLGQTETVGNLTQTTTYGYDANNRLLTETSNGQETNFIYDNNGNTLNKQDSNGATFYTWNDEGRLTQAIDKDPNENTLHQMGYRYNSNGIRVAATTDGQETLYLIDDSQAYAQVLEEYNNAGTVQVSYVYGNDLINQTRDNVTAFYLVDGLGSTRLLTDVQGNVLNTYDYEAFGKTIHQSGTTINQYQFTGEQFDQRLGNYYLRDRFYDSHTGRFTRQDIYEGQLKEPLTLHKYLYSSGNPVNYLDPSGFITLQQGKDAHDAIGEDYINQSFNERSYDQNFRGGRRLTVKRILSQNDGLLNGFPGFNRRRIDLADFTDRSFFEIKPVGRFLEGMAQETWDCKLVCVKGQNKI